MELDKNSVKFIIEIAANFNLNLTRMHSSGMSTVRLLTVSQHALGGCTCPGGVPSWEGVPAESVPAGGVPAGGCTGRGSVPAQGAVPAWGGGASCPGTTLSCE